MKNTPRISHVAGSRRTHLLSQSIVEVIHEVRYLSVWTFIACPMSFLGFNADHYPPNEPRHCRFVLFGHRIHDNTKYFPVLKNDNGSLRLLRLSDRLRNAPLIDFYLEPARAKVLHYSNPAVAFYNAGAFGVDLSQAVSGFDYKMDKVIWKKLGGTLRGLKDDDKKYIYAILQSWRQEGDGVMVWKWDTHKGEWFMRDGR